MLSLFPRDVLGEIWDFIESVSEGFPTYSFKTSETPYRMNPLKLQSPREEIQYLLDKVKVKSLKTS